MSFFNDHRPDREDFDLFEDETTAVDPDFIVVVTARQHVYGEVLA